MSFKIVNLMTLDSVHDPPSKAIRVMDSATLILIKTTGEVQTARTRAEKDALIEIFQDESSEPHLLMWAKASASHVNIFELTQEDVRLYYNPSVSRAAKGAP